MILQGRAAIVPLICAAFGAAPLRAAADPPCPPAEYKYLRYDEDYRFLKRSECRTEALDAVKFVPFSKSGAGYLSLGGEIRETIEYFRNPTWGRDPEGPAYTLQRYMAHADLHMGDRARLFVQVKSGLEHGREGGPRPVDEDKLDLAQAFLDVQVSGEEGPTATLRLGRQEMGYGATRWISNRDGVTVHHAFEGAKLIVRAKAWRVDAFVTEYVSTEPGVFDDSRDPGRDFWGVYATRPLSGGANLDVYYLGLNRDGAHFAQGTANELRHSAGGRAWGKHGRFDYDVEPLVQWGSFGDGDIRAWAVESDTGWALAKAPPSPRLGLRANATSGDRDPSNPDLETFNPLFPRGIYHQIVGLNGHVNFMDLQPTLSIPLGKRLTVTPDWDFIWRESLHDGVYGVAGNLLRPPGGSRARYVGSQASVVTIFRMNRHVTFVQIVTRAFPGPFLEETGPAEPTLFLSGWFAYKL